MTTTTVRSWVSRHTFTAVTRRPPLGRRPQLPPWAQMIAYMGKVVENRSTHFSYRGPLAIHCGKRWSTRGARDIRCRRAFWGESLPDTNAGAYASLEVADFSHRFGRILAVAELVDCHPDQNCCRPWGESDYTEAGGRKRTTVYHLVLEDVRPLSRIVTATGRLGLWNVPDDIAEALREVSTT